MEKTEIKHVIIWVGIAIVIIVAGLAYITYRDKEASKKVYPPEIQNRLDTLEDLKKRSTQTSTSEERIQKLNELSDTQANESTTDERLQKLNELKN